MTTTTPGFVVAAPSSGSGKTTVATGLMAALAARGREVAPFKVGPDYIDPGYHGLASGRPGRNLDPVLVGEHRIAPLYAHGAQGCDIAVVEGVMGLFDGKIPPEGETGPEIAEGSTAHVSGLLGLPVILVIDARGQSQSVAALVRGFATHDSGTRVVGVILNKVGSDRHRHALTAACESVGVPVMGALPRADGVSVPSRHLGLVTASELGTARAAVDEMGRTVASYVDLDAVLALATPPAVTAPAWDPKVEIGDLTEDAPVTVAVAGGPAFSFAYAEHAELLAAAGACVVTVDPLSDTLPDDVAGFVVPGGFPEDHAEALSANAALRREVARLCADGMPVHAECAGLLYLAEELDGVPMCGVLPIRGRFGSRLTLGYRDAVAVTDSVAAAAGARLRGHEFHRTVIEPTETHSHTGPGPTPAWGWRDHTGRPATEGAVAGGVHASYLHVHPAGHPEGVARFVAAARAWRRARAVAGAPGTDD